MVRAIQFLGQTPQLHIPPPIADEYSPLKTKNMHKTGVLLDIIGCAMSPMPVLFIFKLCRLSKIQDMLKVEALIFWRRHDKEVCVHFRCNQATNWGKTCHFGKRHLAENPDTIDIFF